MSTESISTADAQLAVVGIITDTLRWLFADEDGGSESASDESRMSSLRFLADVIVDDLGLTVTEIHDDGTCTALIVLDDPDEDDSTG